jgi:predicted N-acetyltransferase YhbS
VRETTIRQAHHGDIEQLVELRSEFTAEDFGGEVTADHAKYERECRAFLREAIEGDRWHVWVAETGGAIVSHAFVALIDKVPRPVPERTRIAYLTNVYTRPDFRRKGIGAEIIRRAQTAARKADVELMIVWPSDESERFYRREGFATPDDALVWNAG